MQIPYKYNPMGFEPSQDVSSGAVVNVRGVFTYLSNGRCNQSAMSMQSRTLASNNLSRMVVSASGVAVSVKQYQYAQLDVKFGGTVSHLEMMSSCSASCGGVVKDIDMGGSCFMSVFSNGSASDVKLNGYSCFVYVNPSAVAENVSMNASRSYLYVSSNASVIGLEINNSSAYCNMQASAFASNVTMNSNCYLNLSSGAVVNGIALTSGNLSVSAGASVSGVSLASGGFINVGSGAVAKGIDITSGGRMAVILSEVDAGLSIEGVCARGSFSANGSLLSNAVVASANINDYATMVDCDVSGNIFFNNGGKGLNVTQQYGTVFVGSKSLLSSCSVKTYAIASNYGTIADAVVSSNATCFAYVGGRLNNVGVSSGGRCSVYQNGIVNSANIAGTLFISQFGTGANINIDSCGSMYLAPYGNIDNISLSSSAYYWQDSYTHCNSIYCDGGRLYGNVDADTITYGPNGAYYSYGNYVTMADKSFGDNIRIDAYSRCCFNSCQFGDGGYLKIGEYGTVTNCQFGDSLLSIGYNGTVSDVVFASGGTVSFYHGTIGLTMGNGGSAMVCNCTGGVSVGSDCYVMVSSGQNLSTLEMGDGGTLCVSNVTVMPTWSVGNLSRLIFSNCYTFNFAGSVISNVLEYPNSSCTLSNVTVADGGVVYCSGRRNVISALAMDGGSVYLNGSETYINDAVIDGGMITVESIAHINSAVLNSGSVDLLGSNCYAYSILVGSSGVVAISGHYNSVVNATVNQGGSIVPYDYARILNATLSNGATLTIPVGQSSCYVTNVIINDGATLDMAGQNNSAARLSVMSGGSLHVGSNCTANSVVSSAGAIVTVDEGGIINYV